MPTDLEKIKFYETIKEIVETKDLSHFEAIIWYCNETGLEIEVAATLTSPKLKELLEEDARKLHMLNKPSAKLPI
jgi:hypothetical protein